MPEIDAETGKPILEISHSGLNTFASCPKKFAFRKAIVTFQEGRSESDATAAGTALHEGLQEYMRSRDVDRGLEALARAHHIELFDEGRASTYSLEAVAHTYLRALSDGPGAEVLNLPEYELATFLRDGEQIPATEVAFLVVIEMPTVIFHLRGYIDLVLKNPITGRFMAVDIKTTTENGARNFTAKYTWDWQVTSYGIPLNALLGHEGDFEVGIYGCILSDRTPSFLFPDFVRKQRDVDAYLHYLLDKCRQIEHYWKERIFPRHPSACVSFGRICPFMTECAAVTLEEMQMRINPSGSPGPAAANPRPFDPVFIVKLEG